jgi:hypothetical protein
MTFLLFESILACSPILVKNSPIVFGLEKTGLSSRSPWVTPRKRPRPSESTMEGDKMQVDSTERPMDDSVNDSMQGVEGMAAPGKNVLTMGDVPPHPELPPKIDEFQNAIWRRPGDQEAEHKAFYEHLEQFMNSRGFVLRRSFVYSKNRFLPSSPSFPFHIPPTHRNSPLVCEIFSHDGKFHPQNGHGASSSARPQRVGFTQALLRGFVVKHFKMF